MTKAEESLLFQAILKAINEIGLYQFKKCSFFGSNEKKIGPLA